MVFQNHSLLPWLTAFENVQLAVVFRDSMGKAEMRDWIQQNLKLVHMEHAMLRPRIVRRHEHASVSPAPWPCASRCC